MIIDGGPVFPIGRDVTLDQYAPHCGMSLRDYFASQAIIGILGSRNGFLVDVGVDNAPEYAYRVADGMLAEREKVSGPDECDEK